MSGTTIPYGDRPIAYVQQPSGGAFATPEFLQFLERLARAQGVSTTTATTMQAQSSANTADISALQSEVSSLSTGGGSALEVLQVRDVIDAMFPIGVTVDQAGAVALTSGTVSTVASIDMPYGASVVIGTVYLTGTGLVTLASASAGITAGVIETAPGAFATGWFGAGASPTTLGVDLTVGSFTQHIILDPNEQAFLNVQATFTGVISAYGSLVVLPFTTPSG